MTAVFLCRRERVTCASCKTRSAIWRCAFELTGPKAGERCGKALCSQCSVEVPVADARFGHRMTVFCPAHARANGVSR